MTGAAAGPPRFDWGLGHYEPAAEQLAPASVVVVERAAPEAPQRVLDVGCGTGNTALLAAARHDGVTMIRNASSNYMVQDLCFFLEQLGVRVEGVGTTTLSVHGVPSIERDVDYSPSEDPVEAMSLLAAAVSGC